MKIEELTSKELLDKLDEANRIIYTSEIWYERDMAWEEHDEVYLELVRRLGLK